MQNCYFIFKIKITFKTVFILRANTFISLVVYSFSQLNKENKCLIGCSKSRFSAYEVNFVNRKI
jgi:hypothetical protein